MGRILCHTILITKTIPTKLAGLTYLILGEKDIEEFLLFVTISERVLVQKALTYYKKLSEKELDRLTSLFICYGYNNITKSLEIMEQITTIAEKVLLIDTKEPFEKFTDGVTD